MTPEEKRLDTAKLRLLAAARNYASNPWTLETLTYQRQLLVAAMDYAETVHYVEWLRHQTAKEREERLATVQRPDSAEAKTGPAPSLPSPPSP